jgi:hypothetical protein
VAAPALLPPGGHEFVNKIAPLQEVSAAGIQPAEWFRREGVTARFV